MSKTFEQKNPLHLIGYGNQARAWALNARDSGRPVIIWLRDKSPSYSNATQMGFPVKFLGKDSPSTTALCIALLIPDHLQSDFFNDYGEFFPAGSLFLYGHGFGIWAHQWHQKYAQFHHALLAPKSIATELRWRFENKQGSAGIYSIEFIAQEQKKTILETLQAVAKDIGLTVGPFEGSFEGETKSDMFSEQSILCSALPYLALMSYQFLRKRGISQEMAYLECWYETKAIADTLMKLGPVKFFDLISPNALVGSEKGRKIYTSSFLLEAFSSLWEGIEKSKLDPALKNDEIEILRREIKDFWSGQELSQVHQRFESLLY